MQDHCKHHCEARCKFRKDKSKLQHSTAFPKSSIRNVAMPFTAPTPFAFPRPFPGFTPPSPSSASKSSSTSTNPTSLCQASSSCSSSSTAVSSSRSSARGCFSLRAPSLEADGLNQESACHALSCGSYWFFPKASEEAYRPGSSRGSPNSSRLTSAPRRKTHTIEESENVSPANPVACQRERDSTAADGYSRLPGFVTYKCISFFLIPLIVHTIQFIHSPFAPQPWHLKIIS